MNGLQNGSARDDEKININKNRKGEEVVESDDRPHPEWTRHMKKDIV